MIIATMEVLMVIIVAARLARLLLRLTPDAPGLSLVYVEVCG